AAGLAADRGIPLVVVNEDQVPAATGALLSTCGAPASDLVLLGDTSVISAAVADELDRLDGLAC
ncbi:MAG TPA: hypothetical protein VMM13_10730, partial [Euzebya sp.]|nr:hypothetical protein [Euzebya sp.]